MMGRILILFFSLEKLVYNVCFPLGHTKISNLSIGEFNLSHFSLYYEIIFPLQILKAFGLVNTERKRNIKRYVHEVDIFIPNFIKLLISIPKKKPRRLSICNNCFFYDKTDTFHLTSKKYKKKSLLMIVIYSSISQVVNSQFQVDSHSNFWVNKDWWYLS